MQLHEPFLCENCFYDTYFFQENRPPLIHYRMKFNVLYQKRCAILVPTTYKNRMSKFGIVFEKNAKKHFWSCCRSPPNNRTLA